MRLLFLCVLTISCLNTRAAGSLIDLQEKAAQGDPAAQLGLEEKYLYGEGVAKDPAAALKWSQQGAEYAEKNPSWYLRSVAFATLGNAYENGGGVKTFRRQSTGTSNPRCWMIPGE